MPALITWGALRAVHGVQLRRQVLRIRSAQARTAEVQADEAEEHALTQGLIHEKIRESLSETDQELPHEAIADAAHVIAPVIQDLGSSPLISSVTVGLKFGGD